MVKLSTVLGILTFTSSVTCISLASRPSDAHGIDQLWIPGSEVHSPAFTPTSADKVDVPSLPRLWKREAAPLGPIAQKIADAFKNAGNKIKEGFQTAGTAIKNTATTAVNKVKDKVVKPIADVGKKVGEGVKKGTDVVKGRLQKAGNGLKKGAGVIKGGLQKAGNGLKKGTGLIKGGLQKGTGLIKGGLQKGTGLIKGGLQKGTGLIKGGLLKAGAGLKKGTGIMRAGLKKGMPDVREFLAGRKHLLNDEQRSVALMSLKAFGDVAQAGACAAGKLIPGADIPIAVSKRPLPIRRLASRPNHTPKARRCIESRPSIC